jgi:hypothetical protein
MLWHEYARRIFEPRSAARWRYLILNLNGTIPGRKVIFPWFFYSAIAACWCKVAETLRPKKSAAGSFSNTEGYRESHDHGLAFFS